MIVMAESSVPTVRADYATRFKPGVAANPEGRRAERGQFMQVLNRAIKQDDGKRLRKCAETLLDLAAAGEEWATKLLVERLDGKAPQPISVEGDEPVMLLPIRPLISREEWLKLHSIDGEAKTVKE